MVFSLTFQDHFEFPLPAQGRLVLKQRVDFEQVQTIVLTIQVTVSLVRIMGCVCS